MLKLRIDVVKTPAGTYSVTAWGFEKGTGRTVSHHCYGIGFSWSEAHALKKEIRSKYFG